MSPIKRLRLSVVGCNNEYSSRHLLSTSEPLKTQRITFVSEGNALIPICLNASMFAQIIRDPASPTEELSIRVFTESLQITFPNNVLISKFHMNAAKVNSPSERAARKRGAESAVLINI